MVSTTMFKSMFQSAPAEAGDTVKMHPVQAAPRQIAPPYGYQRQKLRCTPCRQRRGKESPLAEAGDTVNNYLAFMVSFFVRSVNGNFIIPRVQNIGCLSAGEDNVGVQQVKFFE